jgi:hypothetical protein
MTTPQSHSETPNPLSEEASVQPTSPAETAGAPSSPSAVHEAEKRLTLRWTELKEQLPKHQEMARSYAAEATAAKGEMEAIRRLLAAHRRLREPVKRKR